MSVLNQKLMLYFQAQQVSFHTLLLEMVLLVFTPLVHVFYYHIWHNFRDIELKFCSLINSLIKFVALLNMKNRVL